MPRRRAGECSRCITRIAPVQCRGCIPRCRVLFVANPLWRRDFDSLLRTITSGCCAMARVKTRSVIALVLALAAEFVFYSVRHVELAFEILSSNKSLFKRKQTRPWCRGQTDFSGLPRRRVWARWKTPASFRSYWSWRRSLRSGGRPKVSAEIRNLVPTWRKRTRVGRRGFIATFRDSASKSSERSVARYVPSVASAGRP